MQGRQIAVVLIALIVIVGAGLFVVSIGDDDDSDSAADATTTTSTLADTTTTTTSTLPPTTTSIPTECAADEVGDTDNGDGDGDEATGDQTDGDDAGDQTDAGDDEEPVIPTLGENSTLSTVGLDTVDFGMTVSQAEEASGHEMVPCEPVGECYRVVAAGAPPGISFLVHEGTIERIDIVDGPIETRSGIGIGTAAGRPEELWPDQIEREQLDADTVDLVFVPTDENDAEFRVVFTAVGDEIASMRAGRMPMVLEADPCGSGTT